MCKAFVSGAWLLCWCVSAQALDQERLWLPQSYHKYHLNLLQAAQAAQALPRCQTVLEGTIDREQSQPNQPLFRILCRQKDGRSYNEMVDGLTFATLTTPLVVEAELTEQEREKLRRQKQAREAEALKLRKEDAWRRCREKIQHRTRLMIDLKVLTQQQPEPVAMDEHSMEFAVDFDAKDMVGDALNYRANCRVDKEGSAQVTLVKR